jgi:hypothetical protein
LTFAGVQKREKIAGFLDSGIYNFASLSASIWNQKVYTNYLGIWDYIATEI